MKYSSKDLTQKMRDDLDLQLISALLFSVEGDCQEAMLNEGKQGYG